MSKALYLSKVDEETWIRHGACFVDISMDATLSVSGVNIQTLSLSLRGSDWTFVLDGHSMELVPPSEGRSYLSHMLVFDSLEDLDIIASLLEKETTEVDPVSARVVTDDLSALGTASFVQSVSEGTDEASFMPLWQTAERLLSVPNAASLAKLAEEPLFSAILKTIDKTQNTDHLAFFSENRRKLEFPQGETAKLADQYYRLLYLRDSVVPRTLDDLVTGFYSQAMANVWNSLIACGGHERVLQGLDKENESSPLSKDSRMVKRRKLEVCPPVDGLSLVEVLFNQLLVAKGIDPCFRKADVISQVLAEILAKPQMRLKGLEILLAINTYAAPLLAGYWHDLVTVMLNSGDDSRMFETVWTTLCQALKVSLDGEMNLQMFYKRSSETLLPLFKRLGGISQASHGGFVQESFDLLASFVSLHGYHMRTWLAENDQLVAKTVLNCLSVERGEVMRCAAVRFLRAVVSVNHVPVTRKIVLPSIVRLIEIAVDEVPSLLFCCIQGLFFDAAREKQNVLIHAILSGTPPECDWPVLEKLRLQRDAIKSGIFVLQVRDSVFLERQDSMLYEDPLAAGIVVPDLS